MVVTLPVGRSVQLNCPLLPLLFRCTACSKENTCSYLRFTEVKDCWTGLLGRLSKDNRVLKQATFLSHGWKPERNISDDRTVVSVRFLKLIVSNREKILNNINMEV